MKNALFLKKYLGMGREMNIFLGQTEEKQKVKSVQELAEFVLDKVNDTEKMTEEDSAEMTARIIAKLEAGRKLSAEEMNFLRRTNPILYARAVRVQRIADAVKEQLRHARSKEEANQIVSTAVSGLSKNDPDKEYIVAAVNRVWTEFHKSGAYSKLPGTVEEAKKKTGTDRENKFADEDKEDDFDLKNWSPLQEVYDQMPTFSAGA